MEAFFFFCSFSNTSPKCQVLFWALGLFTAALSQADLHDLFEIVRVFTCSAPELPPLTRQLEPEAVIVPCTAIKGPILVLMPTFLPFAPSTDGVSHLPLLPALPQATHTPARLITLTEERSSLPRCSSLEMADLINVFLQAYLLKTK